MWAWTKAKTSKAAFCLATAANSHWRRKGARPLDKGCVGRDISAHSACNPNRHTVVIASGATPMLPSMPQRKRSANTPPQHAPAGIPKFLGLLQANDACEPELLGCNLTTTASSTNPHRGRQSDKRNQIPGNDGEWLTRRNAGAQASSHAGLAGAPNPWLRSQR